MNINLRNFYNQSISFFQEKISSITPQQRKIIAVATIALSCLTAGYLLLCCYRKYQIKTIIENGIKFEGIFQNGKLKQGKKTDSNMVYEGHFKENQLFGRGKKTYFHRSYASRGRESTFKKVYEGEFQNDQLNGTGKTTHTYENSPIVDNRPLGDRPIGDQSPKKVLKYTCEGQFKEDKLHGPGKKTNPDGTISEGEFLDDYLFKGKRIYPDGMVEDGEFINSHLVNELRKGKKTYPDGRTEEGEFENGILKTPC